MKMMDMINEQDAVKISEVLNQLVAGTPEFVEKTCKDCGSIVWLPIEAEAICGYCNYKREVAEKTQAWYNKASYTKAPGRFLFTGGADFSISEIIEAKNLDEASEIAKAKFGLDNWYGCNITEFNEYRMENGEYSWGPRTNFLCIAVKEYYEKLEGTGY